MWRGGAGPEEKEVLCGRGAVSAAPRGRSPARLGCLADVSGTLGDVAGLRGRRGRRRARGGDGCDGDEVQDEDGVRGGGLMLEG